MTSKTPASGATGVAVNTTVTGTFSEAVQAGTISFVLKNSAGTTVPSSVSYNSSNYRRHPDAECGAGVLDDLHRDPQRCQGPGRQYHGLGLLVLHHGPAA